MIIRNIDGNLVIVNRIEFKCDTAYNEYIYNLILPFTNLYKRFFIINKQGQLIQ